MAWILTTALQSMRSAWKAAFPNSSTAQDGTIGDAAHQASTSGHNPDDTAGSKSEYSDADSKQEVRALDKDSRLNATATMQQVIDRILATPGDRDRLAYIIFNGYIWRKKNGWRREVYTGSDKHLLHAHFSGDPIHDENGAPWTSVLSFQQQGAAAMAGYTAPNPNAGENVEEMLRALLTGQPTYANSPTLTGKVKGMAGEPYATPHALYPKLDQILAAAQAGGGQVTPTPEQWAALTASITQTIEQLFAQKVGAAAELAAEAALRRVLGGLDGAVPPAGT